MHRSTCRFVSRACFWLCFSFFFFCCCCCCCYFSGNFVNQNTSKGKAKGFLPASLLKIADAKSVDKTQNLLFWMEGVVRFVSPASFYMFFQIGYFWNDLIQWLVFLHLMTPPLCIYLLLLFFSFVSKWFSWFCCCALVAQAVARIVRLDAETRCSQSRIASCAEYSLFWNSAMPGVCLPRFLCPSFAMFFFCRRFSCFLVCHKASLLFVLSCCRVRLLVWKRVLKALKACSIPCLFVPSYLYLVCFFYVLFSFLSFLQLSNILYTLSVGSALVEDSCSYRQFVNTFTEEAEKQLEEAAVQVNLVATEFERLCTKFGENHVCPPLGWLEWNKTHWISAEEDRRHAVCSLCFFGLVGLVRVCVVCCVCDMCFLYYMCLSREGRPLVIYGLHSFILSERSSFQQLCDS